MPLAVRVPRNKVVLGKRGPYRSALNVLNRKQTAVQRHLKRGGLASYEPITQATLLALVEVAPRPAVFFDVGAHIGLYSALIDTVFAHDDLDVRAFEPTPETAEIARELMRANRCSVTVEQLALSSSVGTAHFYLSAKSESSNSMAEGFRTSTGTIEVDVTTLDTYCKRNDVQPSVIKIDVETLEAEVLLGGFGTFSVARPAIVCEILKSNPHEKLRPVLQSLEMIGYTLHYVDESGFWAPTSVANYHRYVSTEHRDWLLLPDDLSKDFAKAARRWIKAIDQCGKDTNIVAPTAATYPRDWNQMYSNERRSVRSILKGVRSRLSHRLRVFRA